MICPECKKKYYGYPALSRKDNKTKICQRCGVIEALNAMNKAFCKKNNENKEGEK